MVKVSKYASCVKVGVLRQLGVSYEDINQTITIIEQVAYFKGDMGSCVTGGGLKANDTIAVTAYSQGCLGPEECYKKIKEYLSKKYPHISFETEYGRMD